MPQILRLAAGIALCLTFLACLFLGARSIYQRDESEPAAQAAQAEQRRVEKASQLERRVTELRRAREQQAQIAAINRWKASDRAVPESARRARFDEARRQRRLAISQNQSADQLRRSHER